MNIIKELKQRGLINNITNDKKLAKAIELNKSVYVGFDPSFKSLHLGNYVMICTLKRFADAGIKVVPLVGGATGHIGDPSGKKAERVLLDKKTIDLNIKCIQNQLNIFFDANNVVNNASFYENMSFIDFLKDAGKMINVNYLLEKETIKTRLETGISFTEFSYTLIQGYDFLKLYQNHNVSIQLGGSDQWGNITTGVEMIRKTEGDDNIACGVTINLLTKSDGTKFGKSVEGAIYLDKELSSPYVMYQFLLNQNDADLLKLLMAFSFKSVDEINKLIALHNSEPFKRLGQKELAKEVVITIHGQKEYDRCVAITDAFFNDKLSSLSFDEIKCVIDKSLTFQGQEKGLIDFMVENKIIPSKSNARDLIKQKAIKLNDELILDLNFQLKKSEKKYSILKKGKKSYYLIIWNN